MGAFLNILLISISLAMDSFSVSIAGGTRSQQSKTIHAIKVALFFGAFQAGMPLLGWAFGFLFLSFFTTYGPWIAFLLLSGIGGKMIYEALQPAETVKQDIFETKTLLVLSIATSIDAFVVGVTLPYMQISLPVAIASIGIVTAIMCFFGFEFGKQLGKHFGKRIEIVGGLVLIGIGIKVLVESFM